MYFNSIAKKRPTTAKRTKKAVAEISSDKDVEQNQGNLTIGKVQLTPSDLQAVEEGKCLQDIYGHLARKQLTVQVVRVQQQQGATACGLYGIAYAVHLANGLDPAKVKFNQKADESSLSPVPTNENLDTFPIEKNITRVARPDLFILYTLHHMRLYIVT